jgi:hypothetical protein
MLGSSNNFFKQPEKVLMKKRNSVMILLDSKDYTEAQIDIYLSAYDYFVENPNDYDGATVVNELIDVYGVLGFDGLDLDAMLHDFHYLVYKAGTNLKYKTMADKIFREGIKRKGKSKWSSWTRYVGLRIVSIPFTIFAKHKHGKMTATDMFLMTKDFNILVNGEK